MRSATAAVAAAATSGGGLVGGTMRSAATVAAKAPGNPAVLVVTQALLPLERLDKVVAAGFGIERNEARRMLEAGLVTRNGPECKVLSKPVAIGDVIALTALPEGCAGVPAPWLQRPELVHSDQHMIIAEKPPGQAVSPAKEWEPQQVGLEDLVRRHHSLMMKSRTGVRLVTPLEAEASGLVLFACTTAAHTVFLDNIFDLSVRYLAVVHGKIPWNVQTVKAPLKAPPQPSPELPPMQVTKGGTHAVTDVKVLDQFNGMTIVECVPRTEVPCQVRAHLAHLGFPVLGDLPYGGKQDAKLTPDVTRPLLHVHRITTRGLLRTRFGSVDARSTLPRDMIKYVSPSVLREARKGN